MAYADADLVWRWRLTVRHPECKLSATARLVLHTLATFIDSKGSCRPSVATIARAAGIGKSTVHEYLNELEREGYVARHKMHGRVTVYVPQIPHVVDEAPWLVIPF